MHADNFILSPDKHMSYVSLMLDTCKYNFYNLIVLARCYKMILCFVFSDTLLPPIAGITGCLWI